MSASERIDVLAVMDAEMVHMGSLTSYRDRKAQALAQTQMREARAAVAELIEVGKHLDAILWLWRETGTLPHLGQLAQCLEQHRAALARVQGEPHGH